MDSLFQDKEWMSQNKKNKDLYTLLRESDIIIPTTSLKVLYRILKQLLKKNGVTASLVKGNLYVNTKEYSVVINTDIDSKVPLYFNKQNLNKSKLLPKFPILSLRMFDKEFRLYSYENEPNNIVQYQAYKSKISINQDIKVYDERVELPIKASKLSSIEFDDTLEYLINAHKKSKVKGYSILLKKDTLEMVSISVSDSLSKYFHNFSNFIEDYQNNRNDFFIIKVPELFHIKFLNMIVQVNLYQYKSDYYIETDTKFKIGKQDYRCISVQSVKQLYEPSNDLFALNDEESVKYLNKTNLQETQVSKFYDTTNKFNTFKFTIRSEDNKFLEQLEQLFLKNDLVIKEKNEKIKQYKYSLQNSKLPTFLLSVFLELKITNKYFYTCTFKSFTNSYKKNEKGEYELSTKLQIVKNILEFLKSNNLYSSTKIKSIGFSTQFENPKYYNNVRLIRLNTDPTKQPYECFYYNKSDELYTISKYYKVYLKKWKKMIEYYQKENIEDPLSKIKYENLTDEQIIEILEKTISKEFKHSVKILVVKEAENLYYAKAISDATLHFPHAKAVKQVLEEVEEVIDPNTKKVVYTAKIVNIEDNILRYYKKKKLDPIKYSLYNKTTELNHERVCYFLENIIVDLMNGLCDVNVTLDSNGNYYANMVSNGIINVNSSVVINDELSLEFKVSMDEKTSFFHISNIHKSQNSSEMNAKCLTYSYNVNRWDTRKEDMLNKSEKKYYFTLNSDIEKVVQNVSSFTKKYKLIYSSKIEFLEKLDKLKYLSKEDIELHIKEYGAIDFLEDEESKVRELLHILL